MDVCGYGFIHVHVDIAGCMYMWIWLAIIMWIWLDVHMYVDIAAMVDNVSLPRVVLSKVWIFPLVCIQAFAKQFNMTPDDLDMHVIYDVSHNIAKVEEHISFLYVCVGRQIRYR